MSLMDEIKKINDENDKKEIEEERKDKEELKKLTNTFLNALKNNVSQFSFNYRNEYSYRLKEAFEAMSSNCIDAQILATKIFTIHIETDFIVKYSGNYYLVKEIYNKVSSKSKIKIIKTTKEELAKIVKKYENLLILGVNIYNNYDKYDGYTFKKI